MRNSLASILALMSLNLGCARQINHVQITDWESFKNIDIYCHSSHHGSFQEIDVPSDIKIQYLYFKIYPTEEKAPDLIAGFFNSEAGIPSKIPFFEQKVDVPTRLGTFSYEWSVSACMINMNKLPQRGMMWIAFREEGNVYDHIGEYSYNCQIVHNGLIKSHEYFGGKDDGVIVKGRTYSLTYKNFNDGIIPYGFGAVSLDH